jgi:hypothetical protein
MNNVFVRLASFKGNVKGSVSLDPNGDYNIYINQNLSYEQQMAALAHEIIHIDNDHLRVMLPAMECEDQGK